jgi:hypothetical protein
MGGGPSHIDTFDPKPMLADVHLNEFVREDKQASAMQGGKRYYVQRPLRFAKTWTQRRGNGGKLDAPREGRG